MFLELCYHFYGLNGILDLENIDEVIHDFFKLCTGSNLQLFLSFLIRACKGTL